MQRRSNWRAIIFDGCNRDAVRHEHRYITDVTTNESELRSLKVRRAIKRVKSDGFGVAEATAQGSLSEPANEANIHRGLKTLSASISQEPEL